MDANRQSKIGVLLLACCLHLAAAIVLPSKASFDSYSELVFSGILSSQPLLLAVWATLPTAPARSRALWAIAMGAIAFYSRFTIDTFGRGQSFQLLPYQEVFLGLVIAFAAYCVILTAIRWLLGWRITTAEPLWQSRLRASRQFSVRELMLWIAGTAVVVVVATWLGEAEIF